MPFLDVYTNAIHRPSQLLVTRSRVNAFSLNISGRPPCLLILIRSCQELLMQKKNAGPVTDPTLEIKQKNQTTCDVREYLSWSLLVDIAVDSIYRNMCVS